MTVKERKEPDQYGNTHYVIEGQTKEEREAKATPNYLKSSGKMFTFSDDYVANSNPAGASSSDDGEDDLPF